MKIEMGESLLRAYFKDVKECLITQTNWKVSENWKADESDSAQLQDIYEKIRSDGNFADAFKTELAQTLRQAEVDVIGIDAAGKLYLAEVAFHEAGLNYGSKTETKDRVIKKLLRAWLAAMKFFPGHRYEIIFASPKVNPATDEIIREYFDILSGSFESPDAHFAYYANDSFRDEILLPTYEKSRAESDTSDLFIRSVRLLDLFSLVSAEKPKATVRKTLYEKAQVSGDSPEVEYRIGERVVDAKEFKEKLLQTKHAQRTWFYADGKSVQDSWDASKKFSHESNLSGNVHSFSRFRDWETTGLVKLVICIEE